MVLRSTSVTAVYFAAGGREPIHGGSIAAVRPPWMAGVSIMQEQFIDQAAHVPSSKHTTSPL